MLEPDATTNTFGRSRGPAAAARINVSSHMAVESASRDAFFQLDLITLPLSRPEVFTIHASADATSHQASCKTCKCHHPLITKNGRRQPLVREVAWVRHSACIKYKLCPLPPLVQPSVSYLSRRLAFVYSSCLILVSASWLFFRNTESPGSFARSKEHTSELQSHS